MSDLRTKLIRLAYENPELREHFLPLLKQSGEFTKDQWKKHKEKFPGAQAHMHTITDNPKSKSKSEDETEAGPSVSQDMKDKVLKEWGIQHMSLMKPYINDLKTLKDVEDTLVKFRHRTHREEDKAVVGALKDIKEALEKAESEKSEKKASLRQRTIRLAYDNPELRKDLLPLLEKKASSWWESAFTDLLERDIKRLLGGQDRQYHGGFEESLLTALFDTENDPSRRQRVVKQFLNDLEKRLGNIIKSFDYFEKNPEEYTP